MIIPIKKKRGIRKVTRNKLFFDLSGIIFEDLPVTYL